MKTAEQWTEYLARNTLATGDALHEYVCRYKCVNCIPYTPAEQDYLNRRIAARSTEIAARGKVPRLPTAFT